MKHVLSVLGAIGFAVLMVIVIAIGFSPSEGQDPDFGTDPYVYFNEVVEVNLDRHRVVIPMKAANITTLDMISYDITVTIDTAGIDSVNVLKAGTLSDNMTVYDNLVGQDLRIAAAGTDPLTGSGTLLNLEVYLSSSVTDGQIINFTFTKSIANDARRTLFNSDGSIRVEAVIAGDVDNNNQLQSYDAAVVLQSVVGLDPLAEDPKPWEQWRFLRADVDGNGLLQAYDAALILQKIVGDIVTFPSE